MILFALPFLGVCEEQIHRIREGEVSPVDGWAYPLKVHARITADLATIDLLIPELMGRAEAADIELRAAEDELADALGEQADLAARVLAAEADAAHSERALVWWAGLGGAAVAAPLALSLYTDMKAPTAMSAAGLSLAAVVSTAWLLGGDL